MIMNRKIFTLLASVLLLFAATLTANAAIKFGSQLTGGKVRTLHEGVNTGWYHIVIDSIFVDNQAAYERLTGVTTPGTPTSFVGRWVPISHGQNNAKWGYGNNSRSDTVVLAVNDVQDLIGISLDVLIDSMNAKNPSKIGIYDYLSSLWCVQVNQPSKLGQAPTYNFTNGAWGKAVISSKGGVGNAKVQQLEDAETLLDETVLPNINWLYSFTYENEELGNGLPLYQNKGSYYLTLAAGIDTTTNATHTAYNRTTNDTIIQIISVTGNSMKIENANGLIHVSLVEAAPFVLDAQAFNALLAADGKLKFDPAPNELSPFEGKLTATDDSKGGNYLNIKATDITDGNNTIADGTIWNYASATNVQSNAFTNSNNDKYPNILTSTSPASTQNQAYRFVYFPSRDSLVINAKTVLQTKPTYVSQPSIDPYSIWYDSVYRYTDEWGLYNDTIKQALIVHSQDLNLSNMLTIGQYPAKIKISFECSKCSTRIENSETPEDPAKPPYVTGVPETLEAGNGLYTVWNNKGQLLGIRPYQGQLTAQWLDLVEGECPDRIPSYQWYIETSTKYVGNDADENKKYIHTTKWYNREFGLVGDKGAVWFDSITIYTAADKIELNIIRNNTPNYTSVGGKDAKPGYETNDYLYWIGYRTLVIPDDPAEGGTTTVPGGDGSGTAGDMDDLLPIGSETFTGQFVNPIGATNCFAPTAEKKVNGVYVEESGLRPVDSIYTKNPYLGYKHFNIGTNSSAWDYGKSESAGDENGMDYTAFKLAFLHSYQTNNDGAGNYGLYPETYVRAKSSYYYPDNSLIFDANGQKGDTKISKFQFQLSDDFRNDGSHYVFDGAGGTPGKYNRPKFEEETYGYPAIGQYTHPTGASAFNREFRYDTAYKEGGVKYPQTIAKLKRYSYELRLADFYNYLELGENDYLILKGMYADGSDSRDELRYGLDSDLTKGTSQAQATKNPIGFAKLYFRDSYFITKDTEKDKFGYPTLEERAAADPSRRTYYAIMQKVEQKYFDELTAKGLELAAQVQSLDTEEKIYSYIIWGVDDLTGDIRAKGKVTSAVTVPTFALIKEEYDLYRRLNSIETDGANGSTATPQDYDAPKNFQVYTRANTNYRLYEDNTSTLSYGKNVSFLGLGLTNIREDIADPEKKQNYNLFFDTAYINRGTGPIKPQYLIAVDTTYFPGIKTASVQVKDTTYSDWRNTQEEIDAFNEAHALWEQTCIGDEPELPEPKLRDTTITDRTIPGITIPAYTRGRYLVNATDSAHTNGAYGATSIIPGSKYIISPNWDRLIFTDAIHYNDRLYIIGTAALPSSVYTEIEGVKYLDPSKFGEFKRRTPYPLVPYSVSSFGLGGYDFAEWNNYHNDVTFSLRYITERSENANPRNGIGGSENEDKFFIIESETFHRTPVGDQANRKIAPYQGGWVSLHNGAVILGRTSYQDALKQSTVFNVEPTNGVATYNAPVAQQDESIRVIAGYGEVTVQNAAGKQIVITNLLGQQVAKTILSSDNATVKAPKGIVIVSVGDKTVKSVVK
jgi:hypothetical protein